MYERTKQTKLDAIDLIISALKEHEKRLDEIAEKLEELINNK